MRDQTGHTNGVKKNGANGQRAAEASGHRRPRCIFRGSIEGNLKLDLDTYLGRTFFPF
jgi:hypothetical protein